jgi:hypothetical protein
VTTLRLSAALAALILTASTACAAVMDFSDVLGPSGGYTREAMFDGQPMTAAQQAYADQEDQLRQAGFRAELGGDFALGQMFYHLAYGLTPPPSAPDSGSGSSDGGASGLSDGGSGSFISDGAGLTMTIPPGDFSAVAAPELSTWAMMLIGFAGLIAVGRRASARPALRA